MSRTRKWMSSGVAAASVLLLALTMGSAHADGRNLLADGSFDAGTSNWQVTGTSDSRLLWLAGGRSGSHFARLFNAAPTAQTTVLNDKNNSVVSTVKGTTYTATAYVRTTMPTANVDLRLMEWGGAVITQADKSVYLTDSGWQQLSVSLTAQRSGDSIDFNVLAWQLKTWQSFDVDGMTLRASMPQPIATTTVVPTTTAVPTTVTPTTVVPATTTTTAAAPTTTTTAAAPAPIPGAKLVFDDEFNGTSVDAAKWNVRNNTYASNETSCVTSRPQNVSEAGGVLTIKAQRENYKCGSVNKSFTSGYLDTIGKGSWTYGTFEMRAKLPVQANTSKGLWPAFWLRPNDGGTGEVDIMEAVGSAQGETTYLNKYSTTIWYDYVGTHAHEALGTTFPAGTGPADGFHTYTTTWTPTSLTWYLDGKKVFERSTATTSWFSPTFNKPFNIRLNMQVGGSWPGAPDAATDFSQGYQVDYVRVYQ